MNTKKTDSKENKEEIIEALESYVSKNQNYKSLIYPHTFKNKKSFAVATYIWDEENTDDEGAPTWQRLNNPIIVETLKKAQSIAQENLKMLAGEMPAENLNIDIVKEVTTILGHDNFYFFKKEQFKVHILENPEDETFKTIQFEYIFSYQEFYYVQDKKGLWHIGILSNEGEVRSWQSFKTLNEALTLKID